MAKYIVRAPDNTEWEISVPEGATEAQALEYAKQQWYAQKSQPKTSPGINMGALKDTILDLPRYIARAPVNLARGIADVPLGIAQIAANAAPQPVTDYFNNFLKRREQVMDELTGMTPGEPNPARIAGRIIPGIALAPQTPAASLLTRMGDGAKIGGVVAAADLESPDNENFWTSKGVKTGVGAVGGALSVPIVELGVRAAGAAANWLVNKGRGLLAGVSNINPNAVESRLILELKNNGVDWQKLPDEYRNQLVRETKDALSSGGKLSPDAVKRLADFQKIGVEPLRGQITRDPVLFSREQNLSKMEAGAPIAERLTGQNTGFLSALDNARGMTGARSTDLYGAGQAAERAASGFVTGSQGQVGAAYGKASKMAGADADIPLEPIAQKVAQVVDEFGISNIPADVKTRLAEYGIFGGNQTKVFTLADAERLRRLMNNNFNPQNPSANLAMRRIAESIDDAVTSAGSTIGDDAARAFKEARGLARNRFSIIENTPALDAAMSKSLPPAENFIDRYVVRGGVDAVKNFMDRTPESARREVQAGVLDWIKGQAMMNSGETAKFSQAGLERALKTIGDRKLETIFRDAPQVLEQIRALRSASASAMVEPIGSGVNRSGSGTFIMDQISRMGNLPFLRGAANTVNNSIVGSVQVPRMLAPPAPVIPAAPLLGQQSIDRTAGLLGPVVAPALPVGIGLLSAP